MLVQTVARVPTSTGLLKLHSLWRSAAAVARPRPALAMIAAALGLLALGLWKGSDVAIGDLRAGVPELRTDSRYNIDSRAIAAHFAIGVDALTVIGETIPQGCIDYHVMTEIDDFEWRMRNVPGVHSKSSIFQTLPNESTAPGTKEA